MQKVIGQFDVTLPVAISVGTELLNATPNPCTFQIQDSEISISPLEYTEAVYYEEHDEWELPRLTEIRVWITRPTPVQTDDQGCHRLSGDSEADFERELVEATRRVVSAVKQRIGQWDVDTRHPVYSYSYRYFYADISVSTDWPLASRSKAMPEYAKGMITFQTHGEVTGEVWQQVIDDTKSPVNLPFYDELLYDAMTLRMSMRYDAAVLYAAIAVELMLETACGLLLKTNDNLDEGQIDVKLRGRKIPALVKMIRRLEPSLGIDESGIRRTAKLRNKIAHGEPCTVTPDDMSTALKTAHSLRRDLAAILRASVSA